MFLKTDFPKPMPSFPRPIQPITIEPDSSPYVCVKFNREWLPVVLGCLLQLSLIATWDTDDQNILEAQLQRSNSLLYLFQSKNNTCSSSASSLVGADEGDEIMIRQNPDNPCILQNSVNGVDWCDWADLSKCRNFGTQTGGGTPQPQPGSSQKYCLQLQANNVVLVPTPVSTGDIITIEASGSGNDGGEIQWRCQDGATYFAGECDEGETRLVGTDPVPTANHMSLIININGTFYPFMSNSFTVPSGVTLVQPEIQVNDSNIADNKGSYDICITVSNNQAVAWSKTFDFRLSTGGWSVTPSEGGQWVSGVGWQATLIGGGPSINDHITLALPAGSYTITGYSSVNVNSSGAISEMYADHVGGGHTTVEDTSITSDPFTHIYSFASTISPTDILRCVIYSGGLSNVIQSITLTGTGSSPF